ncbi:hypothetical protein BKA65DRAFT_293600 [Rhexocercosporidium sp. MPI-PUGE-AT-0058]|nr:hypothetical protein BKA65DRAFT_293600 [Rhexocercosporidium sp. MPI-PUGE-AT-0058]
MAPLPSVLEAQPRLDIRQNAPYQITLTVTRATTTFTTIMNLGGGATSVPPQENPTVITTPVASPDPIIISGSSDPSDNTGVVIGATIGAVAAALLLMIFIWKCCYDYRNATRFSGRDYDSDTSSSSSSTPSSYRRRSGAGFSRRNDRGYRVQVPRRAYSRREKRSSLGSSSTSRSDSTWMRNRRRSGWGNRLFGWVTGTNIRRTRSVYVRRESGSGGGRYGEPRFSVDD